MQFQNISTHEQQETLYTEYELYYYIPSHNKNPYFR